MSFIVRPVNAILEKDRDFLTKMDPYVIVTVGSKRFRSKTHKSGGKNPCWGDLFEIPALPLPNNLEMKVELYDEDMVKDDFLGEGWFNLGMLLGMPGKTENRYIDLVRKGSRCGRVLLQMTYNGPYINQGAMMNQGHKMGWREKAKNFIKGYGTKTHSSNTWATDPFYNQTNQIPPTQWGTNPYQGSWNTGQQYNQGVVQNQYNKENAWKQVKPTLGGNFLTKKLVDANKNDPSFNQNQLGYQNQTQGGWTANQNPWSQNMRW